MQTSFTLAAITLAFELVVTATPTNEPPKPADLETLRGLVVSATERCDVGKLEQLEADGAIAKLVEVPHALLQSMHYLYGNCTDAQFCRIVPTMVRAGMDPWGRETSSESLLTTAIKGSGSQKALCLIDHGPKPGTNAKADAIRADAREVAQGAGKHAILRRLEGSRPDDALSPADLVRYDAPNPLKAHLVTLSAEERNRLLLTAVGYRSHASLRLLLKHGADPRCRDCQIEKLLGPPVVEAVNVGDVEAVRILLKAGAGSDAGQGLRMVFEASTSLEEQLALARALLAAGVTKADRAYAFKRFKGRYGVDSEKAAKEHDRGEGGTHYSETYRLLRPR